MNVWDIAEVSVPSVAFREYLPVLVNFKFENVATPPEAVARPPEIAPPTGPVAIVRVTDDVLLATIALVVAFIVPATAQERSLYTPAAADTIHSIAAEHGMVVAQEKISARVGAGILKQGGNAVDAAVATGFAMAVTYPRAGNIGGGGFMVIHLREHGQEMAQDVAIDYRETAPLATTPEIFLGADGKPDNAKSRDSALSIGVPGTVAGLALALEKYGSGKFTLAKLLQPAIELARNGFVLTDDMADTLPAFYRRLARWPASARIFSRPDGTALRQDDTLIQTDLAATLTAIAEQGPRGFYQGPVAEKLAMAVREAGGIITADDLKSYQPTIRSPVHGTYRGYDIVSMPLPSSGGTVRGGFGSTGSSHGAGE